MKYVCCLLISAVILLAGCRAKGPVESGMPLSAAVQPVQEIPGYLTSPKGGPLRDALGRCWRTADWRPALAIEECDAALARERKLRELALTLSTVVAAPPAPNEAPLSAPELARFEGAPPPETAAAAATPEAVGASEGVTEAAAGTAAATGSAAATAAGAPAGTAPAAGAGTGVGAGTVATAVTGSSTAAPAVVPVEQKPGYIIKPVVLNTDAAFFFGKDRLTVAGKDAVENLAAYIKLWGIEEVQVEVIGHTDRIGSAKDNLLLSKRRADAVKQVLVEAGVPAGSITATGVGSSQPVTEADSCPDDIDRCERINCLAPDRRVEVGLRGTRKAPVR